MAQYSGASADNSPFFLCLLIFLVFLGGVCDFFETQAGLEHVTVLLPQPPSLKMPHPIIVSYVFIYSFVIAVNI